MSTTPEIQAEISSDYRHTITREEVIKWLYHCQFILNNGKTLDDLNAMSDEDPKVLY